MMVRQPTNGEGADWLFPVGFGVVWVAGILTSLLTLRLAISGTLWDLGFPHWLIPMTLLVGIWQWVWVAPILAYARRKNRRGVYEGLRGGGGVVQLRATLSMYCGVPRLVLWFSPRQLPLSSNSRHRTCWALDTRIYGVYSGKLPNRTSSTWPLAVASCRHSVRYAKSVAPAAY